MANIVDYGNFVSAEVGSIIKTSLWLWTLPPIVFFWRARQASKKAQAARHNAVATQVVRMGQVILPALTK